MRVHGNVRWWGRRRAAGRIENYSLFANIIPIYILNFNIIFITILNSRVYKLYTPLSGPARSATHVPCHFSIAIDQPFQNGSNCVFEIIDLRDLINRFNICPYETRTGQIKVKSFQYAYLIVEVFKYLC